MSRRPNKPAPGYAVQVRSPRGRWRTRVVLPAARYGAARRLVDKLRAQLRVDGYAITAARLRPATFTLAPIAPPRNRNPKD